MPRPVGSSLTELTAAAPCPADERQGEPLGSVDGHQAQSQRLLGREVHAPQLLARRAPALDRWIVALQAPLPLHRVAGQADWAGQRSVDERVGVVGAKARSVGQKSDESNIARRKAHGKPDGYRTPLVGGYRANASTRVIGRLPHRLRVAKSSSRSM